MVCVSLIGFDILPHVLLALTSNRCTGRPMTRRAGSGCCRNLRGRRGAWLCRMLKSRSLVPLQIRFEGFANMPALVALCVMC